MKASELHPARAGGAVARAAISLVAVGGLLAAVATPGAARTHASGRTATRRARIVVIVMENHEYGQVIGSAAAPFINHLAARSVLLSSLYAVRHPSLPNYLSLISGSTHGVTTDCTACSFSGPDVVDQFAASAHPISWKAYMETMPSACYPGVQSGRYVKRHDPFMYFEDITSIPDRCARVVPLTQLSSDLAANELPEFSFVTPNLCHDMHDCSVTAGDDWLATWYPSIEAGLGPTGVVVLVWDEGTTDAGCCGGAASGGHIAGIIAGPGARSGVEIATGADQYSILRLIEENWSLPLLNHAATAPDLTGWQG